MAIPHKFSEFDFLNGFLTHSAILDVLPYNPEVLFIGTNNPATPKANFADFFYGRNYLWPALMNLFIYKEVRLIKSRMSKRGKTNILEPTLNDIFSLMKSLKLTFADLILSVLNKADDDYKVLENDNVVYKGDTYNLIQDQKNDKGIFGLAELENIKQVQWNTDAIIKYLNNTPSIKYIYLTRQPTGIWGEQWHRIKFEAKSLGREFNSIYTPSAQGGALHQQTNIYGMGKMIPLLYHWINNPNGKLNNDWLIRNGVSLNFLNNF